MPLDLELQAGAADVVFQREVGEIAVPVERAGARLAELDRVPAGRRARRLSSTNALSNVNRLSALILTSLPLLAVDPDFDRQSGLSSPLALM